MHDEMDYAVLAGKYARLAERAAALLQAVERAQQQGRLSKAAMRILNDPGALLRRELPAAGSR